MSAASVRDAMRHAEQDAWIEAFADWQNSHGEERARNRRYLRGLIQREKARLEKSRAEFRAYVIEYARRHAEYLAFLPPEPERDKALADTLRLLREMEGNTHERY